MEREINKVAYKSSGIRMTLGFSTAYTNCKGMKQYYQDPEGKIFQK